MVDQVLGNCQTVIKNLGRFYRHVQVVSGATILGNGTVALILDPERLVQDAVRATSARGARTAVRSRHTAAAQEGMRFHSPCGHRRRWTERQRTVNNELTR